MAPRPTHPVSVDTMDDEVTNYITCTVDGCDFAAVVTVEHLDGETLIPTEYETLNHGDRTHRHPFMVPGAPAAPTACRL